MRTPSIEVMSYFQFNDLCELNGINDDNVETKYGECAFISILGTPACMIHYMEEPDVDHYFKREHPNVINLNFDDLHKDIEWHGHLFKAISSEGAKRLEDFIERNVGKDFKIHCWAGVSRSAAVGMFIRNTYRDIYNKDYPTISDTPNVEVLRKLNRAYIEKHKIYEEGEPEESS